MSGGQVEGLDIDKMLDFWVISGVAINNNEETIADRERVE